MMQNRHDLPIQKIVSGGQTGVDRAALDVAIAEGIEHGGWCPRGRLSEDGVIPGLYQLTETDSYEYSVRTERNVRDSDGTLILYCETTRGGTELTHRLAKRQGKPCLLLDLCADPSAESAQRWIRDHAIETLNVAGPRESGAPCIGEEAYRFLRAVISEQPCD